jgi:hypothetical protein
MAAITVIGSLASFDGGLPGACDTTNEKWGLLTGHHRGTQTPATSGEFAVAPDTVSGGLVSRIFTADERDQQNRECQHEPMEQTSLEERVAELERKVDVLTGALRAVTQLEVTSWQPIGASPGYRLTGTEEVARVLQYVDRSDI